MVELGRPTTSVSEDKRRDEFNRKYKKVHPTTIFYNTIMTSLEEINGSTDTILFTKNMNDEDAIEYLSNLRQIGRWSAEMFLIFNLCRPDIFPVDDLGLLKGICKCYNMRYPICRCKHCMTHNQVYTELCSNFGFIHVT